MTVIVGTPFSRNAGYFVNDDRNSGGLRTEADIRTCVHCQAIIKMQEWKDNGAFCRKCNAPICAQCGDELLRVGCIPFVQRLEKFTDSVVKFNQYLKMAGLEPVVLPKSLITGL